MHKMCLRKKVYRKLGFTQQMAEKLGKKFNLTFEVYRCPLCGNYHLTTKKDKENENKTN